MGNLDKITKAENDIQRFLKKRGSEYSRPVDSANLINAIERLRLLKVEAQQSMRSLETIEEL